MNLQLQIALIVGIVGYFILLYILLKKDKVQLKYTLLWIFSGLVFAVLAIFPKLSLKVSEFLGIYELTNAIFLITIFCVIMILMSLTSIVSGLSKKIKSLCKT